ncbi:MAG: acyltransferase [Myxococcales bacterium]|jgi:peptidoglycan/LPS O-acetylase OafA/YrhL|nr:acyltransferase [Myxococcales bacterium]HQY61573.1 acyltransferase [Polyangiaceae bacterium]
MATASAHDRAHEVFLGTRRFGALDGLRCLAVVPVVWHHATPRPLDGALGKGPLGVDVFFAISGFLITTLLLREWSEAGRVDVGAFYRRRAARILPLYYAVLALTVLRAGVFLPPTSPVRAHFFASLPAYATFTTTWFVDFGVPHPVLFAYSWSLAVEEQFYALWPWLVGGWTRGGRAAGRPWLAWGACLALTVIALGAGLAPPLGALATRALSGVRLPLVLGALLACILHTPATFRVARALLGFRGAPVVALGLLAAAVLSTSVPLAATHALVVLLVATSVVREDHALAPLLTLPPLRHVGEVSYGIYMLHLAAIAAVKLALGPARSEAWAGAAVFALALPVAVGLATASHRAFERPLQRRFASRRPKAPSLGRRAG